MMKRLCYSHFNGRQLIVGYPMFDVTIDTINRKSVLSNPHLIVYSFLTSNEKRGKQQLQNYLMSVKKENSGLVSFRIECGSKPFDKVFESLTV